MPRTTLTPQNPPGAYPGTIAANAADMTFAAADVANKNQFAATGKELLVVRNDNVGAQTVTINSVVDTFKRTGDITAYSLGASEYAFFGPFPVGGWRQTDGNLYLEGSHADIKFAVIRLP